MAGLTRVPYVLMEGVTPIKWVGDEAARTQVLGKASEDVDNGFFFLQKNDDGTSQIFAMTFSATHVPSWVEISGSGGGGLSDITSIDQLPEVLKDALNDKLDSDFSTLPSSTVPELSKANIVVGKDDTGKPVTITMEQIKQFVDSGSANTYWRGFHQNLEELKNWITDEKLTTVEGCWAILADTDTIWVYDKDTSDWKNTGIDSSIPASVQIKGENGINVTGSLADGLVTITPDTTKLVSTNDPRLTSLIIGKGTEDDRNALSLDANSVGKLFIQTGTDGDTKYGEFYQLVKLPPNPEWLRLTPPQSEQKGGILFPDITIEASKDSITLTGGAYNQDDYIFLVFISGILQLKNSFDVFPNTSAQTTTISLAGSLASTMECNVVLIPKS